MTPSEILDTLSDALDSSSEMPNSITYIVEEADDDGLQAGLKLPVIQITPVTSVSIAEFNTDRSGYVTDLDGNYIGRRYHAEYQMTVQIDVLSVEGRSNEDELIGQLSNSLRSTLYQYDSAGPARNLADSIWKFQLNEGERADDMTMNPTLRRWRQDVDVWSYETFETTEEYIVDVNYPNAADMNDSDNDGTIDDT